MVQASFGVVADVLVSPSPETHGPEVGASDDDDDDDEDDWYPAGDDDERDWYPEPSLSARDARRSWRVAMHRAAGSQQRNGPLGPNIVHQGCIGCNGQRHYALNCGRTMCGVCCFRQLGGPCAWHASQMPRWG